MDLVEIDDAWRVVFFPDALETGTQDDKWEERGFRVQFGIVQGKHVPKWVDYNKKQYRLDQAIDFAKNISRCEHCLSLNSMVDKLGAVRLKDNYERLQTSSQNPGAANTSPVTQDNERLARLEHDMAEIKTVLKQIVTNAQDRIGTLNNLLTGIATDIFRMQYTIPGRIDLALKFQDPSIIDDIIPQNPEEITPDRIADLRAEIADYLAGNIGMYKDKTAIAEYAKLQRDLVKTMRGEPVEEEKKKKLPVHLRGKRVKVVA